ncbi:MAG: hypothetical protein V1913_17645 [Fibrobacterota bacterium]
MKYVIFFAALTALFMTIGCSDKATEPAPAGLKWISMNSGVFKGDTNQLPGWAAYRREHARPDTLHAFLQKATAIDFDEARILVVWPKLSNSFDTASANRQLCAEHQQKSTAFTGRNLYSWEDVLNGWRAFSDYNEIVYTGKLTRKDSTVTGDILVKPGYNDVFVVFIKAGSILWSSANSYIYLSDEIRQLMPPSYSDGWMVSSWYACQYTAPNYPLGWYTLSVDSMMLSYYCTGMPY